MSGLWRAGLGAGRSLWRAVFGEEDTSKWSLWSEDSVLCIGSKGSLLSIGSIGSVLSVGSIGSACSAFSIASAGSLASIMSFLSRWGVMRSGV